MFIHNPELAIQKSDADYLVNTVNTEGYMGKGLALDIKNAFPDVMGPYVKACKDGRLEPGTLQLIRLNDSQRLINFATKGEWRRKSTYEWVGAGLVYINKLFTAQDRLPARMAMSMPGCGNGGLDTKRVQQMMRIYLHQAVSRGLSIELSAAETAPIEDPIFYAGVGSRETPQAILDLMTEIGAGMAEEGYGLRSGGAIGADTAFWKGAKEFDSKHMQIFLPKAKAGIPDGILHMSPVFNRLALNFHTHPDKIRPDPANPDDKRHYYLKLMARNGNQVFGTDFRNPSNAVVCWTVGGEAGGGTGQAIRLANSVGIPVIDLGRPDLHGISAADVVSLARQEITRFRASRGLMSPVQQPEPGLF